MSEPLPELLDNPRLRKELGITRHAADKIMQQLEIVRFPNIDKPMSSGRT